MTRRLPIFVAFVAIACACAPTIRLKVDPITIYAKLDAEVKLRLDEDVQRLVEDNPELF